MKFGRCAYCGDERELTREHMLTTGLRDDPSTVVSVFPPKGRHRLGGQLILEDVCRPCNNVHLGRLDHFAIRWIDGSGQRDSDQDAPGQLLRWCAKSAYNGKRALVAVREDARPIPRGLPSWVVGDCDDNPGFCAALTWIHPSHFASGPFSYAEVSNDDVVDAVLHVRQWVFLISWTYSGERSAVEDRARVVAEHFPAVQLLEGRAINSRLVPKMRDPDWILRGLYSNPVLQDLREGLRRKSVNGS